MNLLELLLWGAAEHMLTHYCPPIKVYGAAALYVEACRKR